MDTSTLIAFAALIVSVAALAIALYGIIRANKTSSAATLVALNEGFRNAWARFFIAADDQKEAELAEIMNLCEIACAICLERSLSGNSAVLATDYLTKVLRLLVNNDYANKKIESLLLDKTTFEFIRKFLREKRDTISVTIPPKWYQN